MTIFRPLDNLILSSYLSFPFPPITLGLLQGFLHQAGYAIVSHDSVIEGEVLPLPTMPR